MLKQISFIAFLCIILTQTFILKRQLKLNDYDIQLSTKYASFAGLAFCSKQCLQSWTCKSGASLKLTSVTRIQNSITKAACYIGYEASSQSVIISWRGSNNWENWAEDFNFQMQAYEKCKNCYIHTGFRTDYVINQKKLITAFEKIVKSYKPRKVIFTGHSLGAALSTLNGVQFAQKYPQIKMQIHNFGSPRLGNENLAKFIDEKVETVFRVVHNQDIVPHLPPQNPYKHVATQIFFDQQMKNYKVCNQTGQDKSCSNKFFPDYKPSDHDFYFVHISEIKC